MKKGKNNKEIKENKNTTRRDPEGNVMKNKYTQKKRKQEKKTTSKTHVDYLSSPSAENRTLVLLRRPSYYCQIDHGQNGLHSRVGVRGGDIPYVQGYEDMDKWT